MELTSVATTATTGGGILSMELKYLIILCMFVEWVKLLHHCYFLWARPMWRFIFTTENTTCRPTPSAVAQANDTIQVFHPNNGTEKSLLNLEIVLKRLGMFCDHDDNRQIIVSNEIFDLFHEDEPSLDEVKEAFSAFDRNKDGFIDAKELQHALSEMGYIQISESDCRLMIGGYDVDQDDKISFKEFLKLMEDCF